MAGKRSSAGDSDIVSARKNYVNVGVVDLYADINFHFNPSKQTIINSVSFIQLCTGGSVTDLVQGLRNRGSRLTESQITYILKETVQALIYLHENHCMHRDVKGIFERTKVEVTFIYKSYLISQATTSY